MELIQPIPLINASIVPGPETTTTTTFGWEDIDPQFWEEWFRQRLHWSYFMVMAYVTLIQVGQRWMKNREPFKLRSVLVTWNLVLFTVSLLAFARSLPILLATLPSKNGFHHSVCAWHQRTAVTTFWGFIGIWSKVFELGDTAFVVLRKQPLIFLHWYHHATVLLYFWKFGYTNDSSHAWFWVMNSGIHTLMYSYYALRAMGKKLPKKISITITILQILQMVVGMIVNIYSVYSKVVGHECHRPNENILYSFLLYLSYCVLFTHYFNQAYLTSKSNNNKIDGKRQKAD